MTTYVLHATIGGAFACTGACTRCLCKHRLRQIALGAAFVLAETLVTVNVVG